MADSSDRHAEVWTRKRSTTWIESSGWIQIQVDDDTAIRILNPIRGGGETSTKSIWDGVRTGDEMPGEIEGFGIQDPEDAPKRRMRIRNSNQELQLTWHPYIPHHIDVVAVGLSDGESPENIVLEGPEVPEGESIRHALIADLGGVKQVQVLGTWPPQP